MAYGLTGGGIRWEAGVAIKYIFSQAAYGFLNLDCVNVATIVLTLKRRMVMVNLNSDKLEHEAAVFLKKHGFDQYGNHVGGGKRRLHQEVLEHELEEMRGKNKTASPMDLLEAVAVARQ